MDDKLVAIYKRMKATYQEAIDLLEGVRRDTMSCRDIMELSDTALAMRETSDMADDLGKECRKVMRLSEKLVNLICLKTDNPGPVRTPHVTASLRPKMAPAIPPRDSAEYGELCEWLGINPASQDMIRIHYPTLRDKVSDAIETGKPVPSMVKPQAEFNLTLRKQKEVDAA